MGEVRSDHHEQGRNLLLRVSVSCTCTVPPGASCNPGPPRQCPFEVKCRKWPRLGEVVQSRAARNVMSTELVRHEWRGRIAAEYRSAALTHEYVLWLIQIGASRRISFAPVLRIVDDELAHAELSHHVLNAALARPHAVDGANDTNRGDGTNRSGAGALPLNRNTLSLPREHLVLEHDVTTAVVRIFCLGETVAVPLFQNSAPRDDGSDRAEGPRSNSEG